MRVVSGIQPTGNLHLGNYLGAIRNWVRCRTIEDRPANASSSSPTCTRSPMPHVAAELRANTREMVAALVACGIDPERALFNQAQVPAHAELQWLLNGTARMGWLNRMTQFKDKSGKNREGASVGLFVYPVLQAADVLLYRRRTCPWARTRSSIWSWRATSPPSSTPTSASSCLHAARSDHRRTPPAARIMSLRDGSAKMSKSDPSDMSRINLTDDADTIMPRR
jgi:tryptophanyl-tRNA synthetase